MRLVIYKEGSEYTWELSGNRISIRRYTIYDDNQAALKAANRVAKKLRIKITKVITMKQ